MAEKTNKQAEVPAVKSQTEVLPAENLLPGLPSPTELREILEANFEGIVPTFETIKIPAGGLTVWTVPAMDSDKPDHPEELIGIILDHYPVRAYWPGAYTAGKTPPTCSSIGGIKGSLPRNNQGEFGECATCAHAQFGTALKPNGQAGRGQACRLKRRVFISMPERGIFPFLLSLSVTSATKKYYGSISTYGNRLGMKKVSDVITRVVLVGGNTDDDGNEYCLAHFFVVSELTAAQKVQVKELQTAFKSAMRNRPMEADEAIDVTEERPSLESEPWDER